MISFNMLCNAYSIFRGKLFLSFNIKIDVKNNSQGFLN